MGEGALTSNAIIDHPVPDSHSRRLRYLVGWLYGSSDGKVRPVIERQGTDRPALQKVISMEDAREHLERTGDFEYAKQIAGLQKDDWLQRILRIESQAQSTFSDSASILDKMSDSDLRRARRSVRESVSILQNLSRILDK